MKGDNVTMDKNLGKIYLDETGKAPFVVFEGKAAATNEYVCWLERIVAEEGRVAALQTTNISVMPCPFHRVGELCFLKNLAGCSMEACLIHRARE